MCMNHCNSEQGVGRGLQPVTFLLNTFNNHSGETPVASYAALPFFVTSQNRALLLDGSEYATFDLASAAPALFSGIIRQRDVSKINYHSLSTLWKNTIRIDIF